MRALSGLQASKTGRRAVGGSVFLDLVKKCRTVDRRGALSIASSSVWAEAGISGHRRDTRNLARWQQFFAYARAVYLRRQK